MNILVALDDGYVKPLQIMLASLRYHVREPLDVYLMYSSIRKENLKLLDGYISELGESRLFPVFVEKNIFEGAPVLDGTTKETYYRILCSELLPIALDRILYLDPDILIRGSIASFYHMDFQNKTVIGVVERPNPNVPGAVEYHQKRMEQLGLKADDIYVNGGVLLMNLDKMRKRFVLSDFMELLADKKAVLEYADQDMLNLYFQGDVIGLKDEDYNYPTTCVTAREFIQWITGGWRKGTAVIVHFKGLSKPWMSNYVGKYYFEYNKYHKRIQTRGEQLCFGWRHFWGYIKKMTIVIVEYILGRYQLSVLEKRGE